jgi:hypothetical protein
MLRGVKNTLDPPACGAPHGAFLVATRRVGRERRVHVLLDRAFEVPARGLDANCTGLAQIVRLWANLNSLY